jgi:hypothetical protein
MTLDTLLDTMSSNEFLLWQMHDAESPIGDERGDAGHALVASTLANINRDTKKRPQPFTVREFMLYDRAAPEDRGRDLSRRARAALLNTGR